MKRQVTTVSAEVTPGSYFLTPQLAGLSPWLFQSEGRKFLPGIKERVYGVRLSVRLKLVPPCFHVPVISELSLLMVPS
jgi:hypothetical protein